jgi:hypothetical protein
MPDRAAALAQGEAGRAFTSNGLFPLVQVLRREHGGLREARVERGRAIAPWRTRAERLVDERDCLRDARLREHSGDAASR